MVKSNAVKCTCSKCGVVCWSQPETNHRRCTGTKTEEGKIRDKAKKLPVGDRGTWSA